MKRIRNANAAVLMSRMEKFVGNVFVRVLCVAAVLAYVSAQRGTRIVEGIRLTGGGAAVTHIGQVEVQSNSTWGTVCSNGWNYNSARVVCRSLGYPTVVCPYTVPVNSQPKWITSIFCRGGEPNLSRCRLTWQGSRSCSRLGAAVCATRDVIGETTNLTVVNTSPYTARIQWTLPDIPDGVADIRFVVQRSGRINNLYYYANKKVNITTFSAILRVLNPNTTYQVTVRTDVKYSLCNGWLYGNFSDVFEFDTLPAPTSQYPVRLVPPWPNVDFLGRAEVMYNGTWGTICQDQFGWDDGNVVCRTLGFPFARCSIYGSRFGQGTGQIWLDNLACSSTDSILEDCSHNGWGVHNCRHNRDVGVICQPRNDDVYLQPVSGLTVENVSAFSVSLSWKAFQFPPGISFTRYAIQFNRTQPYGRPVLRYIAPPNVRFTLTGLTLNANYNINVRAVYRFTGCSQTFWAQRSSRIRIRTIEKAPGGPPTSVHVVPLNSTAIELQWNLPLQIVRNGRIRGFKIFFSAVGSSAETNVTVRNPRATEFIIGGLQPATYYSFSILAYTVADGPQSGYLIAPTYESNFMELIIHFGPYGNGEDRIVVSLSNQDLQVQCGSGIRDAVITWLYANGTLITAINSQLSQVRLQNGTAMLRIGNGNDLEYCDAGTYICKAVWTTGNKTITHTRNFTLLVEDSPPTPSVPYPITIKSSQITIGWYELECDGGHNITELAIRYRNAEEKFIAASYEYIYNIDASRREYTVLNLEPETTYAFAVQAISAEFSSSTFSDARTISTLIAAPSAPVDVSARLIKSPVVEVSWKEPIDHYGIISTYIIYANAPNVTLSNGFNTFHQTSLEKSVNVSGHVGAVNVSVFGSHSNVYFQVSAVIVVDGEEIEGEKSEITSEATVFVPVADLPVPQNVQVVATNTSAIVSWSYPSLRYHVPFNSFEVSYTGMVNWRSPNQYLIQFTQSGSQVVSVGSTSAVITGLTPNTGYTFGVAVITQSYGKGREIITLGRTKAPVGGKLAYFQLKLLVSNCYKLKLNPSVLASIQQSLVNIFNQTLCQLARCELTPSSFQSLSITCANSISGSPYALLRGRAVGGSTISADNMVSLLQIWVLSKSATITTVDGMDISVASDCPVAVDNPSMPPDCLFTSTTSVPTVPLQTSTKPDIRVTPRTLAVPKTTSGKPQSPVTSKSKTTANTPTKEFVKFTTASSGRAKEAIGSPSNSSNHISMAVMGVVLCVVILILIVIVIILMVIIARLHKSYGTPLSVSWSRKSNMGDETGLVPKSDATFGNEFESKEVDIK